MYEQRFEPLLPRVRFIRRLARSAFVALALIATSLLIGIFGYHFIARLGWVDAFLNASMILSGMGPVDEIRGNAAKIFAGCYALFSGIVFITTAGLLLAPLMHRLMHKFHLESKEDDDTEGKAKPDRRHKTDKA